jgi:hypothetical protein
MRRVLGTVVGAIFGVALVATCGSGAGGPGGAGGSGGLGGGGGGGFGGGGGDGFFGVGDAQAQQSMVITGSCDQISTRTITSTNYTSTTTVWFADVSIANFTPTDAPHVSVVTCDPEVFGGGYAPPFYVPCSIYTSPTGCSDSGYTPPATNCTVANYAMADNGRLIINCGQRSQTSVTGTSPSSTDYGQRFRTVYIRIN